MRFQVRQKKSGASKRIIDMTPMIDCVFQLLLFFMVASRFDEESKASSEGALDANLPDAVSAMPMVMRPKEMVINIDADGRFFVSGEAYNETQLAERLSRAGINNPGTQPVVIRGDERADWKYIALVMSLCNQARIRDYRVAVIPPDDNTEGDGP
jgi:biopolymer transport protein ExbD